METRVLIPVSVGLIELFVDKQVTLFSSCMRMRIYKIVTKECNICKKINLVVHK